MHDHLETAPSINSTRKCRDRFYVPLVRVVNWPEHWKRAELTEISKLCPRLVEVAADEAQNRATVVPALAAHTTSAQLKSGEKQYVIYFLVPRQRLRPSHLGRYNSGISNSIVIAIHVFLMLEHCCGHFRAPPSLKPVKVVTGGEGPGPSGAVADPGPSR